MMKRRDFMAMSGAVIASAGIDTFSRASSASKNGIRWHRSSQSRLFDQVTCDDKPLIHTAQYGLLRARVGTIANEQTMELLSLDESGPSGEKQGIQVELRHTLIQSHLGFGEDILEGKLTIGNLRRTTAKLEIAFITAAQPSEVSSNQKVYLPISATGLNRDMRLAELGSEHFYQRCALSFSKGFSCHYLEPLASYAGQEKTEALLLAPVVDVFDPAEPWRVSLFAESDQPWRFRTLGGDLKPSGWEVGRTIELEAGQSVEVPCYLLCHQGSADKAWDVFHKIAHHEEFEPIDWLRDVKVHYYDFLSSSGGKMGRRGDGYEADIPYFKQFGVGLATQHGYYPFIGDFLMPGRTHWSAMKADRRGPASMSIRKMQKRIENTRRAGAKAGIYMHTVLFDQGSALFDELQDSILIGPDGERKRFTWKGPDTAEQNWWMSFAAEAWTGHLLQQAEYIMDLLDPDAIVFDETFVCLGYDHHPNRSGPLSNHSIEFFKKMRRLIRSYGDDKALLTSDCGGSNMVMWADGDAGDHSYPALLGNPLYREEPIRYRAAIGQKPWIPCSWHFLKMWEEQMDLARKMGTGIGLSNGWIEFNGLHGLEKETRNRLVKDIGSLF